MVFEAQGTFVTWLAPEAYANLGPTAADLIRTALSQGTLRSIPRRHSEGMPAAVGQAPASAPGSPP